MFQPPPGPGIVQDGSRFEIAGFESVQGPRFVRFAPDRVELGVERVCRIEPGFVSVHEVLLVTKNLGRRISVNDLVSQFTELAESFKRAIRRDQEILNGRHVVRPARTERRCDGVLERMNEPDRRR
jgi:hypothetical protein